MTLSFNRKQWVVWRGREAQILRTLNVREVQLRDRNGEVFVAPVAELDLLPVQEEAKKVRPADSAAGQKAKAQAEFRLQAIAPLLHLGPRRTRADVVRRAEEVNANPATLYRWIERYEKADLLGLTQQVRSDAGTKRVHPEVESLMQRWIETKYLTSQRPSISSVYRSLLIEIDRLNKYREEGTPELEAPHFETFRKRIYGSQERRRLSRRHGESVAKRLDPITSHYPGANFPLAVVQADHTKLDVILVDSVFRRPLKDRPYITIVMDVFSRVVLGFHLSLDPPSAFSVGQALTQAILPKDTWLARFRLSLHQFSEEVSLNTEDFDWPCWGKPVKFKADNGREFWGKMLERACAQYGIDQEFRPVLKPEYGSHIERIMGNVAQELKSVPGATFSNTQERGDYDSEGMAVMTMDALRLWMSGYLVGVYNHRKHSEIGMTPLQMWEKGLLEGTETSPPTGLPERIMGERAERLEMDFLPFFEATVQRDGVHQNGLTYQGPVLYPYIKAKDPEHPRRSRRFVFRYDPRDITKLYFLDPELDRYYTVRCTSVEMPSMSIWEYRAVRAFGESQNLKITNGREFMRGYHLMEQVIAKEQERSKQARLSAERKRQKDKAPKLVGAEKATARALTKPGLVLSGRDEDELEPFEELEINT